MRIGLVLAAIAVAMGAACTNGGDAGAIDSQPAVPVAGRIVVERFGPFVFAASGVTQLRDGRVLVVEDTKRHPLVLLDLFGHGRVKEFTPAELARASGRKWFNDLEGITSDDRGRIYAITSHSLTSGGEDRGDRELLIRFEIDADTLAGARLTFGLKDAIAALHRALAKAADKRPKRKGAGLNIEGIASGPTGDRLLLGLRSPLIGNSAVVVSLDNATAALERGAAPRLSGPFLLALDGEGIRDLTWDATLGGYLIVAGAAGRSGRGQAALWFWRGGDAAPVRLDARAIAGLKPEGIAIVRMSDGGRALLFVCDDGRAPVRYANDASESGDARPSRYVVIPYDTLIALNSARLARVEGGGGR